MEIRKKIALLEEMMELSEGVLTPDTYLADIEEFDSMAKLSLIVLMNDEFEKKLNIKQIREFKTVQDILNFME